VTYVLSCPTLFSEQIIWDQCYDLKIYFGRNNWQNGKTALFTQYTVDAKRIMALLVFKKNAEIGENRRK
jgi:hypothetical protein